MYINKLLIHLRRTLYVGQLYVIPGNNWLYYTISQIYIYIYIYIYRILIYKILLKQVYFSNKYIYIDDIHFL